MKDSVSATSGVFRLYVTSIGAANAAAAGAISKGLGIAPEAAAQCLYKAPSLVADGLAAPIADQMQELLAALGLETLVLDADAPAPVKSEATYDLGVYFEDASKLPEVAVDLAEFLGASPAQAIAMLCTPPGVILGGVSEPTVEALRKRLERPGVEIMASEKSEAQYGLIFDDLSDLHRQSLGRDLEGMGRSLDSPGTLEWADAERLWRRHGPAGLRIVDMAFLRFDVLLTEWTDSTAARSALENQAGVPADIIDDVVGAIPVALEEGLTGEQARAAVMAYAAAGLGVMADPITFQSVSISVAHASHPKVLGEALQSIGMGDGTAPDLPWTSPPLTELQARFAELVLQEAGAAVSLEVAQ
ncbi:MAG: hypothetical protein AAGF71_01375 [Pseudomonadota bacterium]